MKYRSKLKEITEKIEALEEERRKLLRPIVFGVDIPVDGIPKTKEDLLKLIERVSNLNEDKCSWLDLRIIDISHEKHKDLFIFGGEKFISSHLQEIIEMIQSRKHWQMGHVGVTFYGFLKFNRWHFS